MYRSSKISLRSSVQEEESEPVTLGSVRLYGALSSTLLDQSKSSVGSENLFNFICVCEDRKVRVSHDVHSEYEAQENTFRPIVAEADEDLVYMTTLPILIM